ncbi:MAG: FIST C-terminal domain-containing protein [Candidatus Adiutrix sp.]|jgi:hypothetical protein|nr:FIST C-terminal domain-containing protein [Candidatus Adiutrix sp.]
MIRTLTAFTGEIDDAEAAAAELLEQLQSGESLLKNSVAVVACSTDFIDSGVIRAVGAALPFPVVGLTTAASCVRGGMGSLILSLMVLTSDDVSFAVGLTEPILSPDRALLSAAYEEAAARLPGRPALILSFYPLSPQVTGAGGDFAVETMAAVSGGVPNFGLLPVVAADDFQNQTRIICGGEDYTDRYAFILLEGAVDPVFYVGVMSSEKVLKDKGVITRAEGPLMYSVNDITTLEYMRRDLGLAVDANLSPSNMFPIIIDWGDGAAPVMRAVYAFSAEGAAVCGAHVPQGGILSVGRIDRDEVVVSASRVLADIKAAEARGGLLFFSCVARLHVLDFDERAEMEVVAAALAQTETPYFFCYAGGEICPVDGPGGVLTNRAHNYTFIVLAL